MSPLARFLLVPLLGAATALSGPGVAAANAAPKTQRVTPAFEYDGKADFTVSDQVPSALCDGTYDSQHESGHVSWKTKYDEGVNVRLSGGQVGFTENGVAAPGAQHTWSYTGDQAGCTGAPSGHAHCTADQVLPSVPGASPPTMKVREVLAGGIAIFHIGAIQGDFYMTDVTGTAGVCAVDSPTQSAFPPLLQEDPSKIPLLFETAVVISPEELLQFATSGTPIDKQVEVRGSTSCANDVFTTCSVEVDGSGDVIITNAT